MLALAVLTVLVLTFPAPGPTSIDSLVTDLVQGLPGLFGWFWELSYDLLVTWTVVLLALALFARGRPETIVPIAGGLEQREQPRLVGPRREHTPRAFRNRLLRLTDR